MKKTFDASRSIIALSAGGYIIEDGAIRHIEGHELPTAEDVLSAVRSCPEEIAYGNGWIDAAQLEKLTGVQCRTVIPGHMQRGGSPCAYDRVLSTQFGVCAAQLIREGQFGVTVALQGSRITQNRLADIAGVPKPVDPESQIVKAARDINISFGDK